MHYSNRQLETELARLAAERAAGPADVELPAELPREAFEPSPEVIEFVQTVQSYEARTAHLNVGTY